MDPTLLAGSFMQGFGGSIGGGLTGSSAPISSGTGGTGASFDSSGWNVNMADGTIESSRAQAGALDQYMPYVLIGAALLIAFRMTRRSK